MSAEQIDVLRQLQTIDATIYELKTQQAALPAAIAKHQTVIAKQEKDLAEHHEKIKKSQSEGHNKEVELQTHEEKILKLKGQLNTVGTNKEYSAILHEIEIEKMEMSKIEERVLELMSVSEQLQNEQATIESQLAQEQAELAEIEKRAASESQQIETSLAAKVTDRQAVADQINPEILTKYERVLVKHQDNAMAAVADSACQGCYSMVTAQEVNLLLGRSQVVFCRSCSRILFLPDASDD